MRKALYRSPMRPLVCPAIFLLCPGNCKYQGKTTDGGRPPCDLPKRMVSELSEGQSSRLAWSVFGGPK